MTSIQKFEDLICWQKARELANFVFDLTDRSTFKDYDLKRQIRRAAISSMSNIAEGFDRATRPEFIDALFIAKGEVGEVRSQLYISFDRHYIDQQTLDKGLNLTDSCSRLIQSFADKVKGGAHRGVQFKPVNREKEIAKEILKKYNPDLYRKMYEEQQ